ncbi:hypothetical protein FXO37_08035 [Capsicum annuum]|nr:hypothetical protein FXO37_08035 [Capsicum annuum]
MARCGVIAPCHWKLTIGKLHSGAMWSYHVATLSMTWKFSATCQYYGAILEIDNCHLSYLRDALKAQVFNEDFLDDKLKPFYKLDPFPETNDTDVKIIIGNNFDEIVLYESKDVLLEFKGFPSLQFFPAGNKSSDPIENICLSTEASDIPIIPDSESLRDSSFLVFALIICYAASHSLQKFESELIEHFGLLVKMPLLKPERFLKIEVTSEDTSSENAQAHYYFAKNII